MLREVETPTPHWVPDIMTKLLSVLLIGDNYYSVTKKYFPHVNFYIRQQPQSGMQKKLRSFRYLF